jgi:lysyl endopeptidase
MRLTLISLLMLAIPSLGLTSTAPLRPDIPDVATLLQQDASQAQTGRPTAQRAGVALPLDAHSISHGSWTEEADGRIWTLEVEATGAEMLGLALVDLDLPAAARLSVRTEAVEHLIEHRGLDALRTPPLPGERIELRLHLPWGVDGGLRIEAADFVYRRVDGGTPNKTSVGTCNIDVACPLGDEWGDEIRSVASYSFFSSTKPDPGTYVCTGQLINNTAVDGRRLFLTANHCIETNDEAGAMVLYFNDQALQCGSQQTQARTTISGGANLLMTRADNDLTLLEIRAPIPSGAQVHYSGWDARNLEPTDVVSIHHPLGLLKKISRSAQSTSATPYGTSDTSGPQSQRRYLRVPRWTQGTTEGGSSGAGLWTTDRRIVGVLSGGSAACAGSQPNSEPDWYSRLHTAWNGGDACTSLSAHLDAGVTGSLMQAGTDAPTNTPGMLPVRAPCATTSVSGDSGGLPAPMLLGVFLLAVMMRSGLRRH